MSIKATFFAAVAASGPLAGVAHAQNSGLVKVVVEDTDILSNDDVSAAVPVAVQVSVGIAANVRDVNANVLAEQKKMARPSAQQRTTRRPLTKPSWSRSDDSKPIRNQLYRESQV